MCNLNILQITATVIILYVYRRKKNWKVVALIPHGALSLALLVVPSRNHAALIGIAIRGMQSLVYYLVLFNKRQKYYLSDYLINRRLQP